MYHSFKLKLHRGQNEIEKEKKGVGFLHSLFNGRHSKLFPNADVAPCTPGHGVVLQPFSVFVECILHFPIS